MISSAAMQSSTIAVERRYGDEQAADGNDGPVDPRSRCRGRADSARDRLLGRLAARAAVALDGEPGSWWAQAAKYLSTDVHDRGRPGDPYFV